MLNLPGHRGCNCEGPTRREVLRIGSIGLMGLSLPHFFFWRANAAASKYAGARGWEAAKSVVMIFLQGGPSHLDIWDPKPDAPSNIRGEFKTIKSKIPGVHLTEVMPKLAQQLDKATLIRSVSYTPAGLFNHTAAHYQMMTGYTPDRVSLLQRVNAAMPEMEKATASYALDSYYQKAFDLVSSGRARNAFDLAQEKTELRDKYGRHTFGQGLLLARRLVEAGTRFVQVNWPAVANGDPKVDAWDTHAANFGPLRDLHCPKLDSGLSALLEDMEQRGLWKETLVVA